MHKLKIVFLGVAFLGFSACQNSNRDLTTEDIEKNNPESKKSGPLGNPVFKDTAFKFGEITDGESVQHTFVFKNEGKGPMSITNVEASCGCTSPNWTKELIAPGGEGRITATFNSSGYGSANKQLVEKHVTVSFDNSTIHEIILNFSANIYKKENSEDNHNNH